MKNLLILIITVFFFSLGGNVFAQKNINKKSNNNKNISLTNVSQPVKNWSEFVSDEGKFKILFPGETTTKITDEGSLRTVSQRYVSTEISFAVSYTDIYTKSGINSSETLESLKNMISQNGTLISQTKISQNGIDGWEIVYEKGGQNIFIHRIFVTGNRWYEAIALYESFINEPFRVSYTRNSVALNKFFDSFQLENK